MRLLKEVVVIEVGVGVVVEEDEGGWIVLAGAPFDEG